VSDTTSAYDRNRKASLAVVEQGRLTGRVEHVISGQAIDFEALETLLAFMARGLRAARERSAEP
jgi:hypothetical protein